MGGDNETGSRSAHPPGPRVSDGYSDICNGSLTDPESAAFTAGSAQLKFRRRKGGQRGRTGRAQKARTGKPNGNIPSYDPLLPPAAVLDELPLGETEAQVVERTREEVRSVLDGQDKRLLVLVGPCSIHDPMAGREYAARLVQLRELFADDLLIVMRAYFENPLTVTGWKGLINDPGMDGTFDVHRGLRTSRRLVLDILAQGMPVGCEWLEPITPLYIADAVTWGEISARTTESQVHRQLASGLSMPVGFKNGTSGDLDIAVDACRAAVVAQRFFGIGPAGTAVLVTTAGNPDTHVILRGGRGGPNYSAAHVAKGLALVTTAGLPRRLMVDASHGNSGKDYYRQPAAAERLAEQIADGERGLVGVMLESFLVAGRQKPGNLTLLILQQQNEILSGAPS